MELEEKDWGRDWFKKKKKKDFTETESSFFLGEAGREFGEWKERN